MLGLERLGCEVWLVEQIAPATCVDAAGEPTSLERSVNRAYLETVMRDFGLERRWALVSEDDAERTCGLVAGELREACERADVLFNISGHLTLQPYASAPRRRAYVDLDPGFTQIWHAQGHSVGLEAHDVYFTVGENIGRPGCSIPTGGLDWQGFRPPVVLDEWPPTRGGGDERLTTIATWRSSYGSVDHEGRTLGLKVHEFRRFWDLPTHASQQFEIALDIHPGDAGDLEALRSRGWHVVDPRERVGEPRSFREYIQESGGEFSVAQGVYVDTRSGWFSDRTALYLASGRPALVQDTGLSDNYPIGDGLISFQTLAEAEAGARRLAEDPAGHRDAARRLAEERFDSGRVLAGVLERALAR
jgi:hypothetical protein